MTEGRKGDRKRPLVIDEEAFTSNWDKIFNQGKVKVPENTTVTPYIKTNDDCDTEVGIIWKKDY